MSSASKGNDRKPNKSVRFAANVSSRAVPRRREEEDHHDHGRHKKRPRLERPNEDEADDVDDWEGEDTEEGLPETKELMEAKRQRRVRREGIEDEDDDTHIDASTSLLSENKDSHDVKVEPFNMDAEQNDGSGYFDGDTYVFRKRDVDEEPDAWLESLAENQQVASIPAKEEDKSEGMNMDDWNQEELYAKIIPLVSDTESVLQAIARYGGLLKRHKTSKGASAENGTCMKMAQRALNTLTEASNALLLQGDVDVYQRTRNDFMKLIPDTKSAASKEAVTWEYRGNQDGELHGPYTTAQMMSWIQAGYFIGEQAVQVRTISKEDKRSTVDDLLSDLMDDEEANGEAKEVRGEWKSSKDVDFSAYA